MAAADDWAELQSRMEDKIERDATEGCPPRGNKATSNNSIGSDASDDDVLTMNLCQWQVYPNGSFSASSKTTKTLPPGVYNLSQDSDGRIFFLKSKPMTDTLYDLGETVTQQVIEGIEKFWDSKAKFTKRGILFKRGILLWGNAGSGKTATIAMLIEKLIKRGGIVIVCQHPGMAINALRVLRRIEPSRPLIVIMEDIEEIIEHRGEHDLLSLLDGEHQVNNVVHIATTNYPENLGPRIVNRPSRFDEVVKVPPPNESARRAYLTRFLGSTFTEEQINGWAKDTNDLSIAHLREFVVATQCLDRPFEETIERLKGMKIKPKSSEGVSHPGFHNK